MTSHQSDHVGGYRVECVITHIDDHLFRLSRSSLEIGGGESDYVTGLANCERFVTRGTGLTFIVDLNHHAVWSRHQHRTGKGT